MLGVSLTVLFSLARRRRVGTLRKLLLSVFAIGAILPWMMVRNFGERLQFSNPTNRVDTATRTPPDLEPRRYGAPQQEVADALLAAIDDLGWTLVSHDGTTFEIEVPVAGIGWFIDDMRVTLSEENGTTIVNAQSQSRVGRGDLGENRRHVVQLFTVLDQTVKQ